MVGGNSIKLWRRDEKRFFPNPKVALEATSGTERRNIFPHIA